MNAIHRFFFDAKPMQAMVAARIMLGATLLVSYLMRVPEFWHLYGSDSLCWFQPYRVLCENEVPIFLRPVFDVLMRMDGGESVVMGVGLALLLVSSLGFMIGWRMRLCGFVAMALHLFFESSSPFAFWGWGKMATPFLLYVTLSPAHRWLALDARKNPGAPDWTACGWTFRLVQIHCCLMYAEAGISRLDHDGWIRGEMLFVALTNATYSRFPFDWSAYKPALAALCYGVWILEPTAPVFLWIRPLARWFALALFLMHVVLEVLSNVGWWNYVMGAALLTFFPATWLNWLLLGRPQRDSKLQPA